MIMMFGTDVIVVYLVIYSVGRLSVCGRFSLLLLHLNKTFLLYKI